MGKSYLPFTDRYPVEVKGMLLHEISFLDMFRPLQTTDEWVDMIMCRKKTTNG